METTDGALEDNRACWRRTSRGLADVHLGAVEGSDAIILSARDVVASTPRTTLMRVGHSREVPVRVAPTPTAAIVGRLKLGKEVAVETYDEGAWVRLSPFDPFALRVARDPSAARPDARERALAPDGGLWVLADETLSAVCQVVQTVLASRPLQKRAIHVPEISEHSLGGNVSNGVHILCSRSPEQV